MRGGCGAGGGGAQFSGGGPRPRTASAQRRRAPVSRVLQWNGRVRSSGQKSNGPHGASPEMAIRRLVHAQGLRYRVSSRPLPALRRTADLVFRPVKVAVFIDGCYWHGCPEHYVPPRTNSGYWSDKVLRNITRDRDTDSALREAGWTVPRFWDHEPPDACALQIAATVQRLRQRND
ncbi:very short patch repair endonuclease [Streptomyces albidoflavus]